MRSLPDHLQQAVLVGGVGGELMPGLDTAGTLLHADGWLLENGSSICDAGKIRVSVDQLMPGLLKAADMVREWDPWSVGIQLADENLADEPLPSRHSPP